MQIYLKNSTDDIFESGKYPDLVYSGHICNDPEWYFHPHKHEDITEIVYIAGGEGEYVVGEKSFTAKKGDILIYNSNVLHEEKSNPENPLETFFCGFTNLSLNGYDRGCLVPEGFPSILSSSKYSYLVKEYIANIFNECNSQVMGYEIVSQNLLVSLIVLLLRIIRIEAQKQSEDNLEKSSDLYKSNVSHKIKDYLDRNYKKNITLKDIASKLYVSQDYISHIFKDEIGSSPINYIISRRIGEAKTLLLTTEKTVQEISLCVGYDNPNYFSMLFKKSTGVSPGKFRAMNLR